MSTIEVPTEVPAEAERSTEELFRYSEWVHLGPGAEECEHGTDGSCTAQGHFHAWCRLPNPFQVRDITEKARAAQARYRKILRDEDSDERVVLEGELQELYDAPKDALVDEVIDMGFAEDYAAAVRSVEDTEDPSWAPTGEEGEKAPKLYANIDQDREEWNRQRELPLEKRSRDFEVLEANVAAYGRAIEAEMEATQAPRREVLMQEETEALVEKIRQDRINHKATEVYLHTFNTWQWYVCTFKPRKNGTPNERVWGDINQMKFQAPPEVIFRLKDVFDGLESGLAASRRGKGS